MEDLVQFLHARIDEDRETALGTGVPPDWFQGPGNDPVWTSVEMVLMWAPALRAPYEMNQDWRGLDVENSGLAAHIARHDPTRVLAEVDAKKVLLRVHGPAHDCAADRDGVDCATEEEPCLVLRLLALPYALHPAYRPEWALDPV